MAQRTRPVALSRVPGQAPAGGAGTPGTRRRRRTRFDAPPPRPFALSGWALLPLRAFLGFTFCFAGLQKLANPNFFNANSPSSIQAQLIASIRISPVHLLLGHLLRFAVPIGIVIALAELAVGLGALLGLWTRLAAAGASPQDVVALSGEPLLNEAGQVIGINTAVATSSGTTTAQNIGFAIPSLAVEMTLAKFLT